MRSSTLIKMKISTLSDIPYQSPFCFFLSSISYYLKFQIFYFCLISWFINLSSICWLPSIKRNLAYLYHFLSFSLSSLQFFSCIFIFNFSWFPCDSDTPNHLFLLPSTSGRILWHSNMYGEYIFTPLSPLPSLTLSTSQFSQQYICLYIEMA